MSGTITAPINPGDDFSGSKVIGGTGCIDQVFAVPPDARDVALSWPALDTTYGVTARAADGSVQPLTTCGGLASWLA
jgi:hypothetical protein